jgi:hypothetical protein
MDDLPSAKWLSELADLAGVHADRLHPDHREYFYVEVVSLLREVRRSANQRINSGSLVINVQKKLEAARHAVNELNENERERLARAPILREYPFGNVAVAYWDLILDSMINALAEVTGKDPDLRYNGKRRKPGRPRGPVANYPFQCVVRSLLDLVARYDGRLSFDPKNGGSGSLIKALNHLRPMLPPGFVPKVLPLKTIERIKLSSKFPDSLRARLTRPA